MADTTEQIDDGGPAFPSHPDSAYAGMTLLDWYVGRVLPAVIAKEWRNWACNDIVQMAFMFAEAAIAERNRRNGQ